MSELAISIGQRTDPRDRIGHAALFVIGLTLLLFLAAARAPGRGASLEAPAPGVRGLG